MTDVDQAEQTPSLPDQGYDELIAQFQAQGRQIDWLLQWLVRFVVSTKVELGVTLSVGGNLLSGHLVSHDAYFDQLAEELAAPFGQFHNGTDQSMKEMILSFKPGELAEDDNHAFHFIHLKDAKTYSSDQSPICETGVLWRGRIAAVDGFSIGRIVTH
ncbi:gas vesicle protein [Pseudomonas sp. 21LCFQ02]|uniref:gas vesicle accessory protein GvpU n=1 Tax=unclassified Pseudomonas TaxID=196821 RepID=UPI0004F5E655|nr:MULTISPECIES: gas vesicle accessory protein GvpU [unclassified Pseudomonas]MCO8171188.1 gas vesicle protein [Pseudomonas sp. 21LCFQ02]MCQ9422792.1 gas vesicle protein [Pseudomonas sp. LJDD11]BAP43993.1 gas vesicle protein [Pseudomonas sp. StFLB209]